MRVERHAARVKNTRLRARRSCSAASDLLRSEENERDRLRVAGRLNEKQISVRNDSVFSNYATTIALHCGTTPADGYGLSPHLSIHLAKLNEEIAEKEEDYLALKHYISVKESIEHLNESELNENKEVERNENNISQKT
ncbi:unnamed protein product [Onchocerca ochengi]|uniref:Uncharacterized protein n=1 Tax=Onchocerca ochengi TaxID=42157 RepID=A0A182E1R1_ONCOC|nr:unnamed protein product [Onchocerca ochengi]